MKSKLNSTPLLLTFLLLLTLTLWPRYNWYQDLADEIVSEQNHPDADHGYWPESYAYFWPEGYGYLVSKTLSTEWALLTLERFAPPPPVIPVSVDIKPTSCPNPLNLVSKGVLPVSVLGTEDFDVTTIDPASIRLSREGVAGEVAPLRWSFEDVATPFEGELCGCHELYGDGYIDLSLQFVTQELVEPLELGEVIGDTLPLTLTGNLKEEFGGTPIRGQDCMRVLK